VRGRVTTSGHTTCESRAVEIRNSIKERVFHEQTDKNVGKVYLWLVKFEDVADTIRKNEVWTVVHVTVFPPFIVTEISDALESYHDGIDSGKNGVGIENAESNSQRYGITRKTCSSSLYRMGITSSI
jgi:hypothetical protein